MSINKKDVNGFVLGILLRISRPTLVNQNLKKYALHAIDLFLGERNGKRFGTMLNTVLNAAEEIGNHLYEKITPNKITVLGSWRSTYNQFILL
jgi:hypothetical protein